MICDMELSQALDYLPILSMKHGMQAVGGVGHLCDWARVGVAVWGGRRRAHKGALRSIHKCDCNV